MLSLATWERENDVQVECPSPTRRREPTKDGQMMSGKAWALIQARLPKLYVETACAGHVNETDGIIVDELGL